MNSNGRCGRNQKPSRSGRLQTGVELRFADRHSKSPPISDSTTPECYTSLASVVHFYIEKRRRLHVSGRRARAGGSLRVQSNFQCPLGILRSSRIWAGQPIHGIMPLARQCELRRTRLDDLTDLARKQVVLPARRWHPIPLIQKFDDT